MSVAEKTKGAFSVENQSFILKIGIALIGSVFSLIIISRLVYPFDLGHYEAFSWLPATHILEGKNPYAFAMTPPYSMVPYGILYYVLLAIGVHVFGFNLWWGRGLTVFALIACIWAVARITRKLTNGNRQAALIAVLASLVLIPPQMWTGIMRPDLIALAFAFTALALAFTEEKGIRISPLRLTTIVLLCIAAFFTKHTVLLPTIIIPLRYLQLNKWREAALFSGALALGVGSVMFFMNYTSGGGYVWQHFTHAQGLPVELGQLRHSLFSMLMAPTTIVFSIALVIFALGKREIFDIKDRDGWFSLLKSERLLIFFYCFVSFFTAVLSSVRVGANINYYLETSFVIAIVTGIIYEDFVRKSASKLVSAMTLLLIFGGFFHLSRVARGEYFRWKARPYYQEISDTVEKIRPPGSVCFSIYVELVVPSGCSFYFDDFGEYTAGWTPALRSKFETEVNAGRFAVIVWRNDNFQKEFPNYQLVRMEHPPPERFFPVYLYVLRPQSGHRE